MAMQIVFNLEQLQTLSALSPHTVLSVVDPTTLVFPVAVKFILVTDLVDKEPRSIVYAVCFDSSDILDFYENVCDRFTRAGLEGYEYAESTQDGQGAVRGIQAENAVSDKSTSSIDVRRSQLSDTN